MRRAAKVDANHAAITDLLRSLGAKVQSLAAVGCGTPDLLVGYHGVWYLAEVKDGALIPSHRKLNDAQKKWHAFFRECGAPVFVWEKAEDVLRDLKLDNPKGTLMV